MATITILSAQAGTGSAVNSSEFRVNKRTPNIADGDLPYLAIYGTAGDNPTYTLQFKAPNGTFYSTGDSITGLGLWKLPFSTEVVYRLQYTADSATGSLSVAVFNGVLNS